MTSTDDPHYLPVTDCVVHRAEPFCDNEEERVRAMMTARGVAVPDVEFMKRTPGPLPPFQMLPGVLTGVDTPAYLGVMTPQDMITVHFDSPRLHTTGNGTATLCGRRIDQQTGTGLDHDGQPITWAQALHDCLDTCKACRRSADRAVRLATGCTR